MPDDRGQQTVNASRLYLRILFVIQYHKLATLNDLYSRQIWIPSLQHLATKKKRTGPRLCLFLSFDDVQNIKCVWPQLDIELSNIVILGSIH